MNDLKGFMSTVIQRLENEGRYGTAHVYQSTLNAITRYWVKKQKGAMKLDKVFTQVVLQDFERYLLENMLSMNTASTYSRMLRAIYHRATKEKKVKWKHDMFDSIYTGVRADTKRAILPNHMGFMLTNMQTIPSLKEAQIWFSLLFQLRGMPFIDLARLRKCDLHGDTLIYKRQKTGKVITVNVPSEAMKFITQLADRNPQSPYLLPILSRKQEKKSLNNHGNREELGNREKQLNKEEYGSKEEYRLYQATLRDFNRKLNDIARRMDLGEKISSYTARHTWATTAYQKKCATGLICNAMGHSSIKITETYLKSFEQKEIDRTNKMIISYVKKEAEKKVKAREKSSISL